MCRGVNRHAVASKQAGPAPIGISLAIFGILLPIFTCHFTGHVADRASRRYEYARFGAGPVTTCGPAHFASDDTKVRGADRFHSPTPPNVSLSGAKRHCNGGAFWVLENTMQLSPPARRSPADCSRSCFRTSTS